MLSLLTGVGVKSVDSSHSSVYLHILRGKVGISLLPPLIFGVVSEIPTPMWGDENGNSLSPLPFLPIF